MVLIVVFAGFSGLRASGDFSTFILKGLLRGLVKFVLGFFLASQSQFTFYFPFPYGESLGFNLYF